MKSSVFKTQNKRESRFKKHPDMGHTLTVPFWERRKNWVTYIHCPIYLCHWFIICWELVDLHPITDQFTCDFNFKLGQLTLGNGIRFGNDGNDVHLEKKQKNQRYEIINFAPGSFSKSPIQPSKTCKCSVNLQNYLPTRLFPTEGLFKVGRSSGKAAAFPLCKQ